MADLSQTISIGFSIVGVEPATLWNSGNWGTIVWGSSGDWTTDVLKGIDNAITPSPAMAFDVLHGIDVSLAPTVAPGFDVLHGVDESFGLDSDVGKLANITLDNTLAPASETSSEELTDGSGWHYIFPSNADDAEDRDEPSWASGATASGSWTSQTVTATTWS